MTTASTGVHPALEPLRLPIATTCDGLGFMTFRRHEDMPTQCASRAKHGPKPDVAAAHALEPMTVRTVGHAHVPRGFKTWRVGK